MSITATLDAPAPPGGLRFRLCPGIDDDAILDAEYTMPESIAIAAGERSGTARLAVVDEDYPRVNVVAFAILDYADQAGSAVLTTVDDDTAGMALSVANPQEVTKEGTGPTPWC